MSAQDLVSASPSTADATPSRTSRIVEVQTERLEAIERRAALFIWIVRSIDPSTFEKQEYSEGSIYKLALAWQDSSFAEHLLTPFTELEANLEGFKVRRGRGQEQFFYLVMKAHWDEHFKAVEGGVEHDGRLLDNTTSIAPALHPVTGKQMSDLEFYYYAMRPNDFEDRKAMRPSPHIFHKEWIEAMDPQLPDWRTSWLQTEKRVRYDELQIHRLICEGYWRSSLGPRPPCWWGELSAPVDELCSFFGDGGSLATTISNAVFNGPGCSCVHARISQLKRLKTSPSRPQKVELEPQQGNKNVPDSLLSDVGVTADQMASMLARHRVIKPKPGSD